MRLRPIALIVAVVVLVAVPAVPGLIVSHAGSIPSGRTPAGGARALVEARVAAIEAASRGGGVPRSLVHLPDLYGARPGAAGPVAPTYSSAPAPMGVADLGLVNRSGTIVPTVLDTPSVSGTVSFTQAESVYLDGDGPGMFGVQMNAVATNVTVFGHATDQFWAQDFLSYTPQNATLTFGDNLWNFSSASGLMPANTLYAHGPNGTLVAPYYYFATGPTFVVHYPFSVTFTLSAADVGNRPALYFNYSVNSSSVQAAGSFDRVIFNSSLLPPIFPATVPMFQANGAALDPLGLPNDLELVLVGDGAGDTTTFVRLLAQFSLATWNSTASAFQPIASAYDAGSDTGETSDGVGVFYNATSLGVPVPVATLALGPSFLYGLWGLQSNPGYRILSANVAPANAFLLVTPGTAYNAAVAQWAPTLAITTGPARIAFPNGGNYYFDWQLSDYRPVHRSLSPADNSTTHVAATLARVNSLGIYTPLVAWGNGEIPSIAPTGNGTPGAPYEVEQNQPHAIDPIFGAMNDFLFPVFPGILLVGTTAWVHLTPPSLAIAYATPLAENLTAVGLPATNHLQIQVWNATNLTIEGGAAITGWLSANVGFSPIGEVILWAGVGDLIAGNTFIDQGIGLALYGGSHNTVWGNSFLNSTAPATNQSQLENSGNNTTGIWESESSDLIYNNYFAVPAPAYTPTIDPVSCENACEPATYSDLWNVTEAPAATVRTVLGTNLSGSIIGTTYQGGNYWSNYGTPANPLGQLPYNDGGRITVGGDYVPLVLAPVYPVAVNELGLAAGAVWGVVVSGVEYRTNATLLTVYAPNGTYNYSVLAPDGYRAPATGNFTVNGTGAAFTIDFTALVALTFSEAFLVPGWNWTVGINDTNSSFNATINSTAGTIVFEVVPGTYAFNASSFGYNASPASGVVFVGPTGATAPTIDFNLTAIVSFHETGLRPGTPWTITVAGGASPRNFTTVDAILNLSIFDLPGGPYSWTAYAAGHTVTPGDGAGGTDQPANVSLEFAWIDGTLAGTVNVAGAELWIDGNLTPDLGGAFSVALTPGVHAIVVVASGYVTYYNNASVASGATTELPIVLAAIPSAASSGPGGIPLVAWILIAALALAAVLALALAGMYRRRGRAPPPPVAPYSGTSAPTIAAVAPSARPPWQEDDEPTPSARR